MLSNLLHRLQRASVCRDHHCGRSDALQNAVPRKIKFRELFARPFVPSSGAVANMLFQYSIISFAATEPNLSRSGMFEELEIEITDAGPLTAASVRVRVG